MKCFPMILSSGWLFTCGSVLFSSRRLARLAPAHRGGPVRELPRYVADRLDFEPAVHRGAPGLDARPRGQRVAAREIRAVDPVELLGVALIAQPHDDLQQRSEERRVGKECP